jgi:hypothetical protein
VLTCLYLCTIQAQRAEVDSGSLLDELQQLMQAKADVAQQRADLDRCAVTHSRLLSSCWLRVLQTQYRWRSACAGIGQPHMSVLELALCA